MLFSWFGFLELSGYVIGVELYIAFVCALSFGWCLFVVCMVSISCATITTAVARLSVVDLGMVFLVGLCMFCRCR